MECDSVFEMFCFRGYSSQYTCIIESLILTEPGIKVSFKGKHLDGYSNNDVTGIRILGDNVKYMPAGLGEMFPNLKILYLIQCGLRRLTKNDLIEMKNLEKMYIGLNMIKYIPRDLFEYTRQLKVIQLIYCVFQFIEEGLIDGLKKLELIEILSMDYRIFSQSVKKDLTIIKSKLKRYLPKNADTKEYREAEKLLEEIVEDRKDKRSSAFESQLLETGRLSDMEITIEDETFKVHRFLLVARSSVLAVIIERNQNWKQLGLNGIKKEAFKIILNFIYKEELPADDANHLYLYVACGRLDIIELMQICEEKIKVEEGNLAQVVRAAKTFGSQKLKDEVIKVVQKKFADCNISKHFIENPED